MLLYHVAPASARSAIAEHGLEGASSHGRWALRSEPVFGVFGWASLGQARSWAAREVSNPHELTVDVWEIEADDGSVMVDPQVELSDEYADAWVVLDDGIDPSALRLLGTIPSGPEALNAELDIESTA